MDTDKKAIQTTELVLDGLTYALSHNLDINSEEDVRKILEAIDTENTFEGDIEEFMKLLQAANSLVENDVKERRNVN